MNRRSFMAGFLSIFLFAAIPGCPQAREQEPRPAPVRPAPIRTRPAPGRQTPVRPAPVRPAPTERVPGVSSVSPKTLMTRVNRIRTAVRRNNWAQANRETNTLGADLTRIRGDQQDTGITEMAALNTEYARLQASVKARNRVNTMANLERMDTIIRDMM